MRNFWQFKEEEYVMQEKVNNILETHPPLLRERKLQIDHLHRPIELLQRIILASTKDNDLILDPFCTNLTMAGVAALQQRKYVGILFRRKTSKV
jgi:DNA modification methylase